jgi:hypothetical protein
MRIPIAFMPHTIHVEPFLRSTSTGQRYDISRPYRCLLIEKPKVIRNALGRQVIAQAMVVGDISMIAPPESRVTLPSNRIAYVIDTGIGNGGGLSTPDHIELALT